jgi:oligopeptidase B
VVATLLAAGAGCACSTPPRRAPLTVVARASARPTPPPPRPPVARREPRSTTVHGHTLVDDYFWLRNQDSPEVLAYLRAENAYTDAVMKATEPLQRALYGEMLSCIREDDATPPYKDGGFFYYHRTETGKQYSIYCRKKSLSGAEAVILDLNTIEPGARFVSVADMVVSDDDHTLAYLVDTVGFRQYTLKVKNLEHGTLGREAIPRVDSVAFARDGRTLFDVTEDPQTKRATKTDSHPLLLEINMNPAGHGGQSGRYYRLRDTAFDFAFMLEQVGLAH